MKARANLRYLFSFVEILTLLVVFLLANATVEKKVQQPLGTIDLAATLQRVNAFPSGTEPAIDKADRIHILRFGAPAESVERQRIEVEDFKTAPGAANRLTSLSIEAFRASVAKGEYLPTANPEDKLYFAAKAGETPELMPFLTAYAIALEECQKRQECKPSQIQLLVDRRSGR